LGMVEFSEFDPRPNSAPPLGAADGLEIREALAEDLPALARIAAEREGGNIETHERSFQTLLEERANGGRAVVLAAILAGEPIGFGKARYFTPAAESPPNVAPEGWYLAGLVVAPRHRRRGIGSRLTRARLDWLAARTPAAVPPSDTPPAAVVPDSSPTPSPPAEGAIRPGHAPGSARRGARAPRRPVLPAPSA